MEEDVEAQSQTHECLRLVPTVAPCIDLSSGPIPYLPSLFVIFICPDPFMSDLPPYLGCQLSSFVLGV